MTSPFPKLTFIGWDSPAINLVAKRLCLYLEKDPTSLCGTLLVAPTAESGRRLREYTAALAGKPVLMPRITVPGSLLQADGCATPMQVRAAWTKVLAEHPVHELWQELFPNTPPKGHEEDWVAAQAADFERLEAQLEQHLVTRERLINALRAPEYAHVAEEETARWNQYEDLARAVAGQLHEWGLVSPAEARRARLENLRSENIPKRVVLACLPQLTNQNRQYLKALMALGCPVEIWVNAPADMANRFDAFGQPRHDERVDSWLTCTIPLPDSCIEVAAHSRDMASRIIHRLANMPEASRCGVALGALDADCLPDMETAFANAGWRMLSPGGRVAAASAAGQLLGQLQDCADAQAGADAKAAAALLRNPLLQNMFYPRDKGRVQRFCTMLDAIEQQKFPATAKHLLTLIESACPTGTGEEAERRQNEGAVQYARYIIGRLMAGMHSGGDLLGTLRELGNALSPGASLQETPYGRLLAALSSTILEYATLIINEKGCLRSAHTTLSIIRSQVAQASITELTHEDADIDALGWLELPFAPGAHLVLAGLHEGCVPEAPRVDAFLPDSLRRKLGMACHAQRNARDSFILSALAAGHRDKLHVFILAEKPDGSPATPSSLLLRTDGSLVERIHTLFQHPEAPLAVPAYERGNWHAGAGCLRKPSTSPAPEHINLLKEGATSRWADGEKEFSPSRINEFLACPLRFWMKELLGLSPGDAYQENTGALSAPDLGNLVHETVELFAASHSGRDRDCTCAPPDEELLARDIVRIFDSRLRETLGEDVPPSMKPLYNTYKAKLEDLAKLHAADLAAGWVVTATEQEAHWLMDGKYPFKLRIDRLDENRISGDLRVIDYKTGRTLPEDAHLEGMAPENAEMYQARLPEIPLLQREDGNLARWKNVQLPLYKACMQDCHPGKAVHIGYFMITKGVEPVQYVEWDISAEQERSAMDCTRGVVSMLRSGRGLYAAEDLGYAAKYSEFGALAAEGNLKLMLNLPDFTPNAQ